MVTEWLDEHENDVIHMPWPSQSPDLYPIERLPETVFSTTTINKTLNHGIYCGRMVSLVESMPRRIEAVLVGRGGPTPY